MSGEHGTGTVNGNLSSDPAQQQPLVSRPSWAMLLDRQLPAGAHSLFLLGALKGDVSHSPYLSSQLPPWSTSFSSSGRQQSKTSRLPQQ